MIVELSLCRFRFLFYKNFPPVFFLKIEVNGNDKEKSPLGGILYDVYILFGRKKAMNWKLLKRTRSFVPGEKKHSEMTFLDRDVRKYSSSCFKYLTDLIPAT